MSEEQTPKLKDPNDLPSEEIASIISMIGKSVSVFFSQMGYECPTVCIIMETKDKFVEVNNAEDDAWLGANVEKIGLAMQNRVESEILLGVPTPFPVKKSDEIH